jgi:hypothetical protein
MDQDKPKKKKYIIVGSCLFVVFLLLGTCTGGVLSPLPFLYLEGFRGKVVDTETKQPIPDAAVLAVYSKSVPGIAGSNSSAVDAQETLTDERGEFRIGAKLRWLSLYRGFTEEKIIIFKPGYGAFPNHDASKEVTETESTRWAKKYIVYELPKLETREERIKNLRMRSYHEIPYEKQSLYVEAMGTERKNLGLH